MDRQIIYSGQVPQTTDLLNTNKQAMIALAKLCSDLFGTANLVSGLGCVPTSPASMSVNINPGQIYQLVNVDGTAYSAVPSDTTHSILKQGILLDAQSFALTAPGTVGYSQNYLIQATYLDNDINNTVLPYYNSANPSQAFNGPGGNGTAQPTTRAGQVSLQLVAGTAATTGTQTTPAVTTGYVGIAVITVANGQSTITAGNISAYPNLVNVPMGGFLAAMGERFSGIQTVTASTTLTTAALGALVNVTATGQTVTLPPASNCPNGTSICVTYMQSSGSTTVARNGTDTLAFGQGSSTTSLTLNPGEEVQFVSNGTNGWVSAGQTLSTGVTPPAGDSSTKLATTASIPYPLQNISASVASNALTLGYTPTGPLQFRSTTLGTGVPTAVFVGGALSLTVPSGATLGTTNGTAAQLAILVAYNAGTPVLCVVNTAGGALNLDESGFISPTTISSSSNSTGVIYSASAVAANSPYRVLGFLNVTEATAGTWATAPSLVQGVAGMAIVDLLGACSAFGSSLAANGYQKLPSGLIIQWGVGTFTTAGSANSFPIAFPSAFYGMMTGNNVSASVFTSSVNQTLSGFTGYVNIGTTANSYFLAYGK